MTADHLNRISVHFGTGEATLIGLGICRKTLYGDWEIAIKALNISFPSGCLID
jgi:hypothetical protein